MMLTNVLLIDDDEVTNYINTKILKVVSPDVKVTIALNGLEGLQALDAQMAGGLPAFDLIIVDISMPQMDGWQFIERLSSRAYRAYHEANIVLLTSSVFDDDISKASKLSLVKTFLSKPLDMNKVKKIMKYEDAKHQYLPN